MNNQKLNLFCIFLYFIILLFYQTQMNINYTSTIVVIWMLIILTITSFESIQSRFTQIEPIGNLILTVLLTVNIFEYDEQNVVFSKLQNILFGIQFQRLMNGQNQLKNINKLDVQFAAVSLVSLILNCIYVNGFQLKYESILFILSLQIIYIYVQYRKQNKILEDQNNNQVQKVLSSFQNQPENQNFEQIENISPRIQCEISQQFIPLNIENRQENKLKQGVDLLKEIPRNNKKQNSSKNSQGYTKKQQQKFNQFLFNQFPDGMIVLAQNQEIKHINRSLIKLFNARDKEMAKNILLDLKNTDQNEIENSQTNQMFTLLEKKLTQKISNSSFKNSSNFEANNFYINDIDDQIRSTASNVNEEYIKAISSAKEKSQSLCQVDSNYLFERMDQFQFLYETKMLCQFGDAEVQSNVISQSIYSEGQNRKQQQKFLEIIIKPIIFKGDPFVLIQVRDVTLFNKFIVVKQINKNRQEMLYQVAHEFRTPLNTIISLSENQIEVLGEANDQCTNIYNPIISLSQQLLNYVNDLLDIAQLKAGKFKITQQKFKLMQLFNGIVKLLLPLVSSKNLTLHLDSKIDKDTEIISDPNRIRQIIYNLISNSFKFTEKGGITIIIRKFESEEIYRISVKDTGIGIEQKDQYNLFKAFGKIEDKNHMNTTGVGLGLMISHIIAQKLAQRFPQEKTEGLIVESEGKGKGCTFSFKVINNSFIYSRSEKSKSLNWSLEKQESYSIEENSEESSHQQQFENLLRQERIQFNKPTIIGENEGQLFPQGLNDSVGYTIKYQFNLNSKSSYNTNWFKQCDCIEILIIDDLPFNCSSLIAKLKKYKLKIDKAITFEQVKNFFDEYQTQKQKCCQWIKIILMDLEMPIIDGFQMTKYIRDLERHQSHLNKQFQPSFIIGCSAHGVQIKDKSLKNDMDEFLTKPVKQQNFIQIIKTLLEVQRKEL